MGLTPFSLETSERAAAAARVLSPAGQAALLQELLGGQVAEPRAAP